MMDIKGLFVWKLGSVIPVIQLTSTQKSYLFRTFESLGSWSTASRVITGFLQLLGSLGSFAFYLFLSSISFAYTSQNSLSMGLCANTSDKNPKPIYVIKCTSGFWEYCSNQLLNGLISWITKVHLFVYQRGFICII